MDSLQNPKNKQTPNKSQQCNDFNKNQALICTNQVAHMYKWLLQVQLRNTMPQRHKPPNHNKQELEPALVKVLTALTNVHNTDVRSLTARMDKTEGKSVNMP